MVPTREQLREGVRHISFEMNRYLCTANPLSLQKPFREAILESCLLHSRIIGDFFFSEGRSDDIVITHYYDSLKSKKEVVEEIEKFKSLWYEKEAFKNRLHKKLAHLTYARVW